MRRKARMAWFGAVIAIVGTGCGESQQGSGSDLSIVGGERVSESDPVVRSTVALVMPSGHQFCTGSLISSKLVLTAAHCLVNYNKEDLYIAFGTVAKPGQLGDVVRAKRFVVHEEYDVDAMQELDPDSPPNDIALVALEEAAPNDYAPIGRLKVTNSIKVGESVLLAGFGLTKWSNTSSGILHKVSTLIGKVSPEVKEFDFAAVKGKSACMGDSGGPAFVTRGKQMVLIGVTSRGNAKCASTGTYTDVRYFANWINESAQALRTGS